MERAVRAVILAQSAAEHIAMWPGILLPSAANMREHWAVKAKRVKGQREAAFMLWRASMPSGWALPVSITLCRISPRQLDSDNLTSAFKGVRDGIADALQIDDGAKGLTWRYEQRRGKPKEVAVQVTLTRGIACS